MHPGPVEPEATLYTKKGSPLSSIFKGSFVESIKYLASSPLRRIHNTHVYCTRRQAYDK